MSVSPVSVSTLFNAAQTGQANPVTNNKQGDLQRTAPETKLAAANAAAVSPPGRLDITA
jgi:hypothetical protein